ncbi:hypothetical protein FGO68_gene1050 [Halteria grandinella]|uniref:Uncharacterized protein n=1 Tax=Halteria grandinella TaxID=5974 RepID=A0A8J8NKI8_HALGN|nr:hypothetical protein FGO68_gene1050 [Halteria grandinella]
MREGASVEEDVTSEQRERDEDEKEMAIQDTPSDENQEFFVVKDISPLLFPQTSKRMSMSEMEGVQRRLAVDFGENLDEDVSNRLMRSVIGILTGYPALISNEEEIFIELMVTYLQEIYSFINSRNEDLFESILLSQAGAGSIKFEQKVTEFTIQEFIKSLMGMEATLSHQQIDNILVESTFGARFIKIISKGTINIREQMREQTLEAVLCVDEDNSVVSIQEMHLSIA